MWQGNKAKRDADIEEYIIFQIETVKTAADEFGLNFLSSYLELAKQVIREEMMLNRQNKEF